MAKIKEKIEKSSFFYHTEFEATDPKPNTGFTRPNFVTYKINHINDEAKQWIFLIPQQLDHLIRGSFSLYVIIF